MKTDRWRDFLFIVVAVAVVVLVAYVGSRFAAPD